MDKSSDTKERYELTAFLMGKDENGNEDMPPRVMRFLTHQELVEAMARFTRTDAPQGEFVIFHVRISAVNG